MQESQIYEQYLTHCLVIQVHFFRLEQGTGYIAYGISFDLMHELVSVGFLKS